MLFCGLRSALNVPGNVPVRDLHLSKNANIGPCSEVCVWQTRHFMRRLRDGVSLFSNTRVRVCDRIPSSIIKIDKRRALEEGSRPTPHSFEYNLNTERHPTFFRRNEDRIRATSGTAVQINIHHITKWTKFNKTVVQRDRQWTYNEDLRSCDRASWAKCEERKTNKMQQLDVYYQLLSQHVSGIIMLIFRRTKALLLHLVYCSGSAGCGW